MFSGQKTPPHFQLAWWWVKCDWIFIFGWAVPLKGKTGATEKIVLSHSRWAWKSPPTWKTAWIATSSTCSAPYGRSAARASRTSWSCRGWRCQSTWRSTHPPSTGSCSALPTELQRHAVTHDFELKDKLHIGKICGFSAKSPTRSKTAVCVPISAPADGDDGEVQEAGQQVSAFKHSSDEVNLMRAFFLSAKDPQEVLINSFCDLQNNFIR